MDNLVLDALNKFMKRIVIHKKEYNPKWKENVPERKENKNPIHIIIHEKEDQLEDGFSEYPECEFIYNEYSLQHLLGYFLRNELKDKGFRVEFERNIGFFGAKKEPYLIKDNKSVKKFLDGDKKPFVKSEVDICLYNKSEKYAIELKFPRNGQYPEEMYSFVKDIKFMEQLKKQDFTKTYCLCLVDDKNFYGQNNPKLETSGIYEYFRKAKKIGGEIVKPTGKDKGTEKIEIKGKYDVNWRPIEGFEGSQFRYYIIEVCD